MGWSTIISIPDFSTSLHYVQHFPQTSMKKGEIETNLITGPWPLTDIGRSVSSRSEQRWYFTLGLTDEERGNLYLCYNTYNIVPNKLGLSIKLIWSIIISIPDFPPLYTMSKTFLSCVENGEIETNLIPGPWPLTDTGRSVSQRSVQRWYLGVDRGRERETLWLHPNT